MIASLTLVLLSMPANLATAKSHSASQSSILAVLDGGIPAAVPLWDLDVPRSTLEKELLPAIQANSAWRSDSGYEMVLGQSDEAIPQPADASHVRLLAEGKLRLRQKPGSMNALGQVKFIFPNEHNVYLHDTPARNMTRTRVLQRFSHRVASVCRRRDVCTPTHAWETERAARRLEKRLIRECECV